MSPSDVSPTLLPVLQGPALPEEVCTQAVEWMVALQAPGANEATQQAWQHWRTSHADHERAWRHIESFSAQLRGLDAPLVHGTLERGEAASRQRRRAIRYLAVALFTGSGAWLARDPLHTGWQDWTADHRTRTGERRTVTLADATRIDLDTASAIAVRFSPRARLVELLHGQILITTGADATGDTAAPFRPFLVNTPDGRLRALGTRFSVRRYGSETHLAVFDGAVEIQPALAPSATRVLRAGEQTRFGRLEITPTQPLTAGEPAWAKGMLVARDMPLAEFVAELERYRPGRVACAPGIAHLKVSGIYPLDDTDRVIDMLLRTQPVEARTMTRFWITLRPRGT
jgi:transmembrane sensor